MSDANLGGVSWQVDADTTGAVNSVKSMDKAVSKTELTLKNLDTQTTKTSKAVNKGMAKMGRGAGQAGIQFQQFIGQVQGGQSAMLALSQQSADLGFVLGAPLVGAIVGISASLIGMLLPALFDSKTGLEKLEKATENVKASMTLGVDGVADYTKEMKKLKAVSETLLKIKLATLLQEQNAALKEAGEVFKQTLGDAQKWYNTSAQVFKLFGKETKAARESFKDLEDIAENFTADNASESIGKMEEALKRATAAGLNNTKEGRKLTLEMVSLIAAYKTGEKTVTEIQKALKDSREVTGEVTEENKKAKKAITSMVESLQLQAATLGMTDRETALYAATRRNATQADLDAINAAFDLIEAEDQKLQKQKEIDAQMDASFRAEEARERRKKSEREQETKKAITTTESIITRGETPEEKLQAEQDMIESFREKGLISAQQYQDALTQIDKEGADARMQSSALVMGSFANSFDQVAGVLKKSEGEQSTAYKAMFALSKGFAIAQAGLNLATAISNASAVSPWYASLAAIAQVTAAGAGIVSAVSGATYSGRENGGAVNAGQTYEVGEKNKPELLMIPGNNGRVMSNAEMKSMAGGGGGGGYQPIINNYAAADGYTVRTRRDEVTRQDIFDIVQSEMTNSNSKSRRGLQSNSNVHGILNGNRRS